MSDRLRPASAGQEQLWITHQQDPTSTAYNMCALFALTGPLDVDRLAAGLRAMVRRHEVLRTTLTMVDGDVRQVVRPTLALPVPVRDVAHLPPAEHDAVLDEITLAEQTTPFDLERGPLFRARLLRHSDRRHHLHVSTHHAVSDGWSMRLLFDDLVEAYARPSHEDDPTRRARYADYVDWQRATLAGPRRRELVAFWRRALDQAPPLLGHPTDRRRLAERTGAGASHTVELDAGLVARVRTTCHALRLTPFSMVLAAYALVLSRVSGQDDLVVGVPMDGRGQQEQFHDVFGLFVNVAPVRLRCDADTSAADHLTATRDALLDAYANHELPFKDIVAAVAPDRSLGHTPIYQVMCGTAVLGEATREQEGVLWHAIRLPQNTAKCDLNLTTRHDDDRIVCHLNYDTALLDRARVAVFADQVVATVAQLCAAPAARVGDVDLRTASARPVLPDLTAPLPSTTSPPGLVDRIAKVAAASPDALAVRDLHEVLNYATFWRRVEEVAARLHGLGVAHGDRVAVLADRSAWLPCLLTAIIGGDVGATVVLIDSTQPAHRVRAQLEATRPALTVSFDRHGGPAFTTRTGRGAERSNGAGHVLFTSGSSARPVPVASGIAPLTNFLAWQAETFALTPDDRFGVLSGLGHDPLLRDVFAPLWSGCSAHFPGTRWHTDPPRTNDWLAARGISVLHATPSQLDLLSTGEAAVPSLRLLFLGGEPLTAATVAKARRWAPNATVVNAYGATETPQIAAYHVVDAGTPDAPVPVGRGAAGAQLAVLVPSGQTAGVGELGEIVVRSRHLADGYLPGGAHVQDAFRSNPHCDDPHDRLYLTGDIGRYLPSGEVVFAGRRDRRINVNGHRVEPGEVEAALLGHRDIATAAVVLRPGDELMTAFCVPVPGATPAPDDLRHHLAERLPGHLLPGAVVVTDDLPLTPTGKTDHSALERGPVATSRVDTDGTTFAPRDTVEAAVARCWTAVVGSPPTDREQSFFAVGHSLTAMRLVVGIRRELSVDLPFRKVFEHPSVAGIATYLRERLGAG